MYGKLMIFTVFATLAQSSIALPLTVDYGLSKDQLAPLTQIIVNQDATVQAKFDGFDAIFDIIAKYMSALVWNVEARSDDDSSKIAQALVRVKDAINYSLDAVLISLQEHCDAVEVARNETHADLDHAYAVAADAMTLARLGNFSGNRAELEGYRAAVQEDLKNLVSSVYNSIRTCLATTDVDTLNLIQAAQDGSGLGLVHVVDAVFNAIDVYAAAVDAGEADVALIVKIEDFRRYGHIGLRADVENKFSALKTLYISSQLKKIEILSRLATNQYALTVSFYRYEAATQIVLGVIDACLTEIALGLYDTGDADFSLTDAAQSTAVAKLNAGNEVVLMSVLCTHPDASDAIAAAKETVNTLSADLADLLFHGIAAARDRDLSPTKAQDVIETSRNSSISNVKTIVNLVYDLLRDNGSWDADSEAGFTNFQRAAPGLLETIINQLFDSISVLSHAVDVGSASDDDFNAIEHAAEVIYTALDDFTQGFSAAGVIVIEATGGN